MTRTDDDRLEGAFEALSPSTEQLHRIESALGPAFQAPLKPLWLEWAELLRIRPLLHGGMVVLNTVMMGLLSPAAQVVRAIGRAVG